MLWSVSLCDSGVVVVVVIMVLIYSLVFVVCLYAFPLFLSYVSLGSYISVSLSFIFPRPSKPLTASRLCRHQEGLVKGK